VNSQQELAVKQCWPRNKKRGTELNIIYTPKPTEHSSIIICMYSCLQKGCPKKCKSTCNNVENEGFLLFG